MNTFKDLKVVCTAKGSHSSWLFVTMVRTLPKSDGTVSLIDNAKAAVWEDYAPVLKMNSGRKLKSFSLNNPKAIATGADGKPLPPEDQVMLIGQTEAGWRIKCPKCPIHLQVSNEKMAHFASDQLKLGGTVLDISNFV